MQNKIFLALLLAPIILISACVGGSAEQVCQAKCSLSSSSEYCKCYNSCYADVTGTMSPECKRPGEISTPEPTYSPAQAPTTTTHITKISEQRAIEIAEDYERQILTKITEDSLKKSKFPLKKASGEINAKITLQASSARLTTYKGILAWELEVKFTSRVPADSPFIIEGTAVNYVNADTGEMVKVVEEENQNVSRNQIDFASTTKGAKTEIPECSTVLLPLPVGSSCAWGQNSIVDDSYFASDKSGYAGCEAGTGTCQLTVDLGSIRNINKIATRLWDNDYRSYYGYSIEVSTDSSAWKKVVDKLTTTISGHQIDTFSDIDARYIRYTGKGNIINQGFHIIEVDAFGKQS